MHCAPIHIDACVLKPTSQASGSSSFLLISKAEWQREDDSLISVVRHHFGLMHLIAPSSLSADHVQVLH